MQSNDSWRGANNLEVTIKCIFQPHFLTYLIFETQSAVQHKQPVAMNVSRPWTSLK